MCASYGLTSESRRRRAAERQDDAGDLLSMLNEPETFDEKRVDERIFPTSLDQWLDDHEEPAF